MKRIIALSLMIMALIVSSSFVTPTKTTAAAQIPVFCYHAVVPTTTSTYQTSLASFKEQMAYLKNNGYTTLTIDNFYNIINNTATAPSKPVLLTFDDCSSDFNSNVLPVLKQYGFKATQFAVSSWIDGSGRLTSSQIQALPGSGIDVQNHTSTHQSLPGLSDTQKKTIVNDCTTKIKSITGKTTTFFAYPNGSYDTSSVTVLKSLGFKGAFKVGGGFATTSSDKFAIPRIVMVNTDTLSTFTRKLTTGN